MAYVLLKLSILWLLFDSSWTIWYKFELKTFDAGSWIATYSAPKARYEPDLKSVPLFNTLV